MIPSPEPYPAPTPHNPQPFWDYTDFLLFVLLAVSSLLVSLLVGLAFTKFNTPLRLLLPQILWYALALGALKALLLFRYQQPFWQSLGWRPLAFSGSVAVFLAGPFLALALSLLGAGLHAPEINLLEPLLGSTATTILLGIVAVILGPVFEELAFRGFLMPLLIRSLGAAGGIIATGVIFGSIHGYEYQWSWQFMALVSLAGCAFGWAKYKTGSTVAAALMHSSFNLMQFAAFLLKTRTV